MGKRANSANTKCIEELRLPFISIVICSYNKPELLKKCLLSIWKQDYLQYEIIIIDGGSDKCTLDLINSSKLLFENFRMFNNPKRLPEGKGNGKWLGYKNISPEAKYVAFIDQDNEIQGKDWLQRMIEPMERNENAVGSHSRLLCSPKDALINRYTALIGTDPFAAYRSIDGYLGFNGYKHAYCQEENTEEKDYLFLWGKTLLVTGGNAFVYKRSALETIGGYTQDTDNIALMSQKVLFPCVYIPDAYTHHHAFSSIWDFIRKKMLWGKQPQSKVFKWIPEDWPGRFRLGANVLMNLTVIPNIYIAVKNALRDKESAWLLHPPMAFITTVIYGANFIVNFIKRKIFKE